jgi:hypothetical protein
MQSSAANDDSGLKTRHGNKGYMDPLNIALYIAQLLAVHTQQIIFTLSVLPTMIGDIQDLHKGRISFSDMPTQNPNLEARYTLGR